MEVLRVCRVCGFEAITETDLDKFKKNKTQPHGVATICKSCHNKRTNELNKTIVGKLSYTYNSMIQRCYNENNDSYDRYGGKGIDICNEWLEDKGSFILWGLANGCKHELQIDRIDNSLGYSPENCRWVTRTENQRNRERNVTDFINKTRVCCICKEEKPIEEFSTDRGKPLGKHYYCKLCYKKKYG